MRWCKYCREWKPKSDFYGWLNGDERMRQICLPCREKIARKAARPDQRFGVAKAPK